MQQFHPIHGQTEKNQFDCLMWLCAASDSASSKYKRALFLHGCFFSSSLATPAANMINSSFVHRYRRLKDALTHLEQSWNKLLTLCPKDYFSKSCFIQIFVRIANRTGFPCLLLSHGTQGKRQVSVVPPAPAAQHGSASAESEPEAAGRVQHTQREPRHV